MIGEHEETERRMLASLHAHCPEATRDELGLFLEEVEGALVAGARRDPSTLLNRALGLGSREAATPFTIEAIRSVYARHGVSRYLLNVYPDRIAGGRDAHEAFHGDRRSRGRRSTALVSQPTALRVQGGRPQGELGSGVAHGDQTAVLVPGPDRS